MFIRLIHDFSDKDFQEMFVQYFDELGIDVDDYDKLFDSMNDGKNTQAFIAYDFDKPVGFIMFCIDESEHWFIKESFGFVREFWVHPNYRKKHWGNKLLDAAESYFIEHHIYKVILTTDTAETFYLKHGYSYSFSHSAKNEDPVFTKTLRNFVIKETDESDLENIMNLWNNGNVMQYVGFPEGLNIDEQKIKDWHQRITNSKMEIKHYSVYLNHEYCGESFYRVDEHGYTALDIKLLPFSRKNNLAYSSLAYVIENVFTNTKAKVVYVDPHEDNQEAWKLYKRLGFKQSKSPDHLDVNDPFQIITKEQWKQTNKGE